MKNKHPRGLYFIFFTEMWERVGFYTLLAILTLYLDKVLGWPDARKGLVYGVFLALCYFVPLLGGWIGDRLLGQLRTVNSGAVLMILGYVGLGLSGRHQVTTLYLGLLLIGLGTGIFKVNMSVLVGNLYYHRPELKDAGFNIFYMGVNVGAMIAPLLATFIGIVLGNYNVCFWTAAIGLGASLLIFRAGRRHLLQAESRYINSTASGLAAPALEKAEVRQRLITLVILFLIVIIFWVAFYQNGFALTLFAERSTRHYRLLRPETYQFFEPFFILALTPLLLSFFSRLGRRGREPSTPAKIFWGLLCAAMAMLVMVIACLAGGNRDLPIMSPSWLITSYLVITLAEILISPMGQSFVSKVAPPRLQGLMMGGWYAATAAGAFSSGVFGRFYSDLAHYKYFLMLAGLLIVAALLILAFLKKLQRYSQ